MAAGLARGEGEWSMGAGGAAERGADGGQAVTGVGGREDSFAAAADWYGSQDYGLARGGALVRGLWREAVFWHTAAGLRGGKSSDG